MIYLFGLLFWLELSLLFECWATVEWRIEGPLYQFFMQDSQSKGKSE